jgi:hypothetical protein
VLAATALSWSHTCAGTNRLVLVGVALGKNSDIGMSMSVTYGGTAMTSLGLVHTNNSTGGFVQLWRLIAPAVGAATVAITAAGGTPNSLAGGSISLTGVDQITPTGTPATAFGTSATPSVAVPGTTAGNMVVDAAACGSAMTSSAQTNRWLKNADGSTGAGEGAGSTAAAGGSVTMSYTVTSDWWGIVAVEALAVAAASVPPAVQPYTARRRASLW